MTAADLIAQLQTIPPIAQVYVINGLFEQPCAAFLDGQTIRRAPSGRYAKTVADLLAQLQEMPPDAPICIEQDRGNTAVAFVEVIQPPPYVTIA